MEIGFFLGRHKNRCFLCNVGSLKSTEKCIIDKFLKTIDAPLSLKFTKEKDFEYGNVKGSKLLKPNK